MACTLVHRPRLVAAALACAALGLAEAARAQTITVTPNVFGFADCEAGKNITISWDFQTTFVPSSTVAVTLTADSACAVDSAAPVLSPTQTQSGTVTVQAGAFLFKVTHTGCSAAVSSSAPQTIYACARFPATGTATQTLVKPVTFALTPPTPPIALEARPGDTHVRLSWTVGDATEKIATYNIYARPAADLGDLPDGGTDAGTDAGADADAGTDAGTADGGTTLAAAAFDGIDPVKTSVAATNFDVTETAKGVLANDTTYAFAVRAVDQYGNVSDFSDLAFGTPRQIDDFYNHYRDSGGAASGGGACGTAGSAGWLVAVLAALLLLRRRKRGAGAALLVALAVSAGANAQDGRPFRGLERDPRRMLFALKIDRYDPQVDTEFPAGVHPYHDIFGGRAPLRWQLEGDWQVAHPFGTFLLGGTIGYWQNIGKGLDHATGVQSGDTALLDVIPFGLIATYRFDYLADRYNVPIIPYAQIGLQAALWASFNGRGDVTTRASNADTNPGGRGSGWTTGYTTALGFALALDWLDPNLSREAYNDVHLQRTSLFAEYGWTNLTGFGSKTALTLSDRAWRFGLALEF